MVDIQMIENITSTFQALKGWDLCREYEIRRNIKMQSPQSIYNVLCKKPPYQRNSMIIGKAFHQSDPGASSPLTTTFSSLT
mmetsp:Transcript_28089/g.56293  ORF Transcript_28089/g.56293 Transcript_28089/m.56293 type:complete len:81 (-) Transcript_28089:155-397(-)